MGFPSYGRALFRRAACLLEAGQHTEAVKAFEVLLRVDRGYPNLCEWLVRAHAQAQRAEKLGGGNEPRSAKQGSFSSEADAEPVPTGTDYYTVLGVTSDATDKQLKQAYRIMSLKYHPDKKGGSTQAFQLVATAFQTLSDPEKRRAYDEGADVKKGRNHNDSESDSEREERSLREEVERKYYPERYKFWPLGDPFIEKRKVQARQRRRTHQPAWHQQDF